MPVNNSEDTNAGSRLVIIVSNKTPGYADTRRRRRERANAARSILLLLHFARMGLCNQGSESIVYRYITLGWTARNRKGGWGDASKSRRAVIVIPDERLEFVRRNKIVSLNTCVRNNKY